MYLQNLYFKMTPRQLENFWLVLIAFAFLLTIIHLVRFYRTGKGEFDLFLRENDFTKAMGDKMKVKEMLRQTSPERTHKEAVIFVKKKEFSIFEVYKKKTSSGEIIYFLTVFITTTLARPLSIKIEKRHRSSFFLFPDGMDCQRSFSLFIGQDIPIPKILKNFIDCCDNMGAKAIKKVGLDHVDQRREPLLRLPQIPVDGKYHFMAFTQDGATIDDTFSAAQKTYLSRINKEGITSVFHYAGRTLFETVYHTTENLHKGKYLIDPTRQLQYLQKLCRKTRDDGHNL